MVFVQEGLQFSQFPGTPKIDPKSDSKALQMAPKMHKKVIWSRTKKNTKKGSEIETHQPGSRPVSPQTPLHNWLRP